MILNDVDSLLHHFYLVWIKSNRQEFNYEFFHVKLKINDIEIGDHLMKIAIVGFGVSGAALLMALKTSGKLDTNIQVDIFDPSEEPAVGLAYGKDDKHLLINAFPTAMSLNQENKFEFTEWLRKNYPEYNAKVDLIPRPIFGEYAKERLTPLLEEENVTFYQKEVADIFVNTKNGIKTYDLIDLDNKQYDSYDYLLLALGTPPYQDFYNLRGVENYIHNPFPVVDKLGIIPEHKRVGIIGSGLTAFDLVNYLSHEKDLKQPIGIFTNIPYFNTLRVDPYQGPALEYTLDKAWINKQLEKHHGIIPLENMLDAIKHDLNANRINLPAIRSQYDPTDLEGTYHVYFDKEHPELSKLQGYIGQLAGNLGDLYMALTNDDKARYHTEFAPLFRHYRVRLAPDAVENMYHLMKKDELFVVTDLVDIHKEDTFTLTGADGKTYETDIVINASGFSFNTDRIGEDNTLLSRLLDKGFLRDKDKRGVLVSWPETQVMNQIDGVLETCFYIGPWLSNTHYGNNNVKALVQKAHEIVTEYMDI